MKSIYFLIVLVTMGACKTQDSKTEKSNSIADTTMSQITDGCPSEGNCTSEIHTNSKMMLKEDTTGAIYPEITEGNNTVIVYNYIKKGPEGTVDGNYSETLHFEIPNGMKTFSKEGMALQDVNLLYGKQCYCKGEAGFYKVSSGTLKVQKEQDQYKFNIDFSVEDTSHELSKVSGTFKL